MNNLEKDYLELRLAEQEILRQSLDEKNGKIRDLERELEALRNVLNTAVLAPRPAYAPALAKSPKAGPVPRRWSVR